MSDLPTVDELLKDENVLRRVAGEVLDLPKRHHGPFIACPEEEPDGEIHTHAICSRCRKEDTGKMDCEDWSISLADIAERLVKKVVQNDISWLHLNVAIIDKLRGPDRTKLGMFVDYLGPWLRWSSTDQVILLLLALDKCRIGTSEPSSGTLENK